MLKHHSPAKSGHSIIKKKSTKNCRTCALSVCDISHTFTAKDDDCL